MSGYLWHKDHCWCSHSCNGVNQRVWNCSKWTARLTGGIPLHLKFTLWKYSGAQLRKHIKTWEIECLNGCLTALDLQSIQNILSLRYYEYSTVWILGINPLWWTSIILFMQQQKKRPYFDSTFISFSFSGDKAAHCWDTCVIMRVSGASCLLTLLVLSTPLPLCFIQSVAWGGLSAPVLTVKASS